MKPPESLIAAVREATADGPDEEPALLWVCRDIPGDHVGGPHCFCCPRVVSADDEVGIQALLASLPTDA